MVNKSELNNLEKDVQIIRQILFGEQLEKFNERLEDLEAQVQTLLKENRRLEKQFGEGTAELRNELETEKKAVGVLIGRVDSFSAGLDEHLLVNIGAIREALNAYKRTVGGKFSRLEKKAEARFLQMQTHQENLVSSLAEALLAVRQENQGTPAEDK